MFPAFQAILNNIIINLLKLLGFDLNKWFDNVFGMFDNKNKS